MSEIGIDAASTLAALANVTDCEDIALGRAANAETKLRAAFRSLREVRRCFLVRELRGSEISGCFLAAVGLETMWAVDVLGFACWPSAYANFPVLEQLSAMRAFDDHMFHA